MYAVYYWKFENGTPVKRLIYAPNSGEDGYFISAGSLDKGINMAGSLSITVPSTNPAFNHYMDNQTPSLLGQGYILSVEQVEDGIGKEIWRGRVISQNYDIYRNLTIDCEGILAYLNDILLPPYNFAWSGVISHAYDPAEGLQFANLEALKDFLPDLTPDGIKDAITDVVDNVIQTDSFMPDVEEVYNTIEKGLPIPTISEDGTEVEDNVDRRVTVYDYLLFILTIYNTELTQDPNDKLKQLKVGYIDPVFKTDRYLINHKTDKYTNVWEEINTNIIEAFKGIMYLSNWYINSNGEKVFDETSTYLYYYEDCVGEGSQIIQYGENLVDFDMEINHTERVSRWYVFGSVKDQNGKETLVDMSSVNGGLKYVDAGLGIGTISKVEYTDLTTPQDCYNKARELMQKTFFATETTTITAVDMNLLDHSIESFEPGYKVRAIMDNKAYSYNENPYHEYSFILESVNIDLLSPEQSKYTFKRSNSDQQGGV